MKHAKLAPLLQSFSLFDALIVTFPSAENLIWSGIEPGDVIDIKLFDLV